MRYHFHLVYSMTLSLTVPFRFKCHLNYWTGCYSVQCYHWTRSGKISYLLSGEKRWLVSALWVDETFVCGLIDRIGYSTRPEMSRKLALLFTFGPIRGWDWVELMGTDLGGDVFGYNWLNFMVWGNWDGKIHFYFKLVFTEIKMNFSTS